MASPSDGDDRGSIGAATHGRSQVAHQSRPARPAASLATRYERSVSGEGSTPVHSRHPGGRGRCQNDRGTGSVGPYDARRSVRRSYADHFPPHDKIGRWRATCGVRAGLIGHKRSSDICGVRVHAVLMSRGGV